MPSPDEVLTRVKAVIDTLQPADAAMVAALAGELQGRVIQYGSLGLIAMSLCSARITAGVQAPGLVLTESRLPS